MKSNQFQWRLPFLVAFSSALVAFMYYRSIANKIIIENVSDWAPIVSVIIPYYNSNEEWLNETLTSLNAQSMTHIQVILVNDASLKDFDTSLLQTLSNGFQIKMIQNRINIGLASARNTGVLEANAPLVLFLDPDDLLDPLAIEKLLLMGLPLLHSPVPGFSDKYYGFIYSGATHFGDMNTIVYSEYETDALLKENFLTLTALISRQVYLEIGGTCPSSMAQNFEDWDFWLRAASLGFHGKLLHEPLIHDRRHSQGGTNIKNGNEHRKQVQSHNPIIYGDVSYSTGCHLLNQRKTSQEYLPCYQDIQEESDDSSWIKSFIIGGHKQTESKKTWCMSHLTPLDLDVTHLPTFMEKYHEPDTISILYMIPWMVMGGSNLYDLQVLASLRDYKAKNVHITLLVAKDILEHTWEANYIPLVDQIFYLQRLSNDSVTQDQIMDYLIKSRNVKLLINSRTVAGYDAFKRFKDDKLIKKLDILHTHVPDSREDWEWRSAQLQGSITKRIVVSNHLKNYFINQIGQGDAVLGVQSKFRPLTPSDKDKIKVIYPPLDIQAFIKIRHCTDSLDCFQFISDQPTVMFIGRLDSEKMPRMFLDIARALPWAQAKIIGSGPMETALKSTLYTDTKYTDLSRKLNFTGSIPHNEIPFELIHSSRSVLIQTSKNDGMPIAVMEALALGTPVVTPICGGVSELIEDPIWDEKPHFIHQYAHERLYTVERYPHASLIRVDCEFIHTDSTFYNDVIHLMSIEATAQLQSLTRESRFARWIQAQSFLQKYSHQFKKEWDSLIKNELL